MASVFLALAAIGTFDALAQLRIVTWGSSASGLGDVPQGLSNIRAVAAGYYHSLALLGNGRVVAWGDNSVGQTNGHLSLTNIVAIAAGQYHNLALRSNGAVFAWGLNNYGQLNVPAGATNVKAIAASGDHCLVLRSNGTVLAWGKNLTGQTNVPPGLAGVAAISAGDAHCMALRSNGTLVAWGDNDSGQTNIPASLTNIIAIAAGYHHNLAIRSNRTVAAWELNVYGETNVPPGLSNVVAVAANYFFSVALRSNGTVVAWGKNFSGETNVPIGLTNVVAISAGSDHVLALTPSPVCPPGFPDSFECRPSLTGSNLAFSVSNAGATSEPGEPQHFDLVAGKSVWHSWTAPFSGSAVITVTSSFPTPCIAVYTGTNLATLTNVLKNSTTFSIARAVFNATAGVTYQIALDGTTFNGSSGAGSNFVTLRANPPPANDAFAARAPIVGMSFAVSNSFVGGTQEAGEPSHTNGFGNAAFKQTLWWTWTAPFNVGVATIPVRLIADAVSYPPNIGVYTGGALGGLTAVPVAALTNGMTRVISFNATAGAVYQIALGGQHYDPIGNIASPRYGNFHFRLNVRAVTLDVINVSHVVNGDDSISFTATVTVTNRGAVASNPLRVRLISSPGLSVKGPDAGIVSNSHVILLTTNLAALGVGQGTNKQVSSTLPAPTENGSQTLGVGYGAYAELQEQIGTNWFTLDQTIVQFGEWPGLGGFGGPGGGVIRLDPGFLGLPAFNPLLSVLVLGPASVTEGGTGSYTARASYSDGTVHNFTNTAWTASRFSISTNGLFTTGSVTSNSPVTLGAPYSYAGLLFTATTNVTVLNLPPPVFGNIRLQTTGTISMTLTGVPGRLHVLEATTNISPPTTVWTPLVTNAAGANGQTNLTASRTNFPRRFYRAREL